MTQVKELRRDEPVTTFIGNVGKRDFLPDPMGIVSKALHPTFSLDTTDPGMSKPLFQGPLKITPPGIGATISFDTSTEPEETFLGQNGDTTSVIPDTSPHSINQQTNPTMSNPKSTLTGKMTAVNKPDWDDTDAGSGKGD